MSMPLNLNRAARFSATLAPHRESRDLTAAITQLVALESQSRIMPAPRPTVFAAPTFGRRAPQAH